METILGLLMVLSLIGIYILPAAVARARDHHQESAIWALNILLGWTFIGWVIALVWALTAVRKSSP